MKVVKKIILSLLIVLGSIVVIALGYLEYIFISYSRIGDQELEYTNRVTNTMTTGTQYAILSYNIGFGAYEDDYGFFMDGGHESWAWSKERLEANLNNIAELIAGYNSDINIIQEVDFNATRSYHYDEPSFFESYLNNYNYTFCQNYNSPFLAYPFYQPHGKNRSGLLTLTKNEITKSNRVELPIETGFSKFLDLDRCYDKVVTKIDNGGTIKELVIFNFHLSAYTIDGTIAIEQLQLLLQDMDAEYAKGNYVIAGGDFNKDLLGNSGDIFGRHMEATWANPIPEGIMEASNMTLVAPFDPVTKVPSCRNADGAYKLADGTYNQEQFLVTVDGFMISPNVEVVTGEVVDIQFRYSDHNPVRMEFILH